MAAEAEAFHGSDLAPDDNVEQDYGVSAVRKVFHDIYAHISFDDCLHMSVAGTMELKLERDNFTYGETALLATAQAQPSLPRHNASTWNLSDTA